jgi:hypothetical protein
MKEKKKSCEGDTYKQQSLPKKPIIQNAKGSSSIEDKEEIKAWKYLNSL